MPGTGYRLQGGDRPPWIRFIVLMACGQIGADVEAAQLWPIFMKFLKDQPVTSLVNSLTRPPLGTKWTRWATRSAGITDAVFTPGEEKDAVASARLELPDGVPRQGREPGYAMLLLHFEPPAQSENRVMAARPVAWTDHLRRALELPDALNRLLTKQLGLSTSAEPPVVLGFRLEAQKDLTDLIDITGLTRLPGGQHGCQARDVDQVSEVFLRSEEHTSELQSHLNLVCRLLLEKKKCTNLIIATAVKCRQYSPPFVRRYGHCASTITATPVKDYEETAPPYRCQGHATAASSRRA